MRWFYYWSQIIEAYDFIVIIIYCRKLKKKNPLLFLVEVRSSDVKIKIGALGRFQTNLNFFWGTLPYKNKKGRTTLRWLESDHQKTDLTTC